MKLGLVSGWVDPPGFNVWDEYVRHSLSNTGEAVFIYKVSGPYGVLKLLVVF